MPVFEDQGSGVLVDLSRYGLPDEPTVGASIAAGADVVSASGDKLLGGPQAGLLVGRREVIQRLKKHPMARAVRLDKMTLAALEATLRAYLEEERALREIPTLRMLTEPQSEVRVAPRRVVVPKYSSDFQLGTSKIASCFSFSWKLCAFVSFVVHAYPLTGVGTTYGTVG